MPPTVYIPPIPPVWILEHAVNNPTRFKDMFIQVLIDQIASNPDQPPLPPTLLIALLNRIFSSQDSLRSCSIDFSVHETMEYLELLEQQRIKRIKALEKRGGPIIADFIKTANAAHSRYNFALIGIKYWTVYNEIARVPFNPYNTISLIASLFAGDDPSQSQSQGGSPLKPSPDAQRQIEMTTLVNHISKNLTQLSKEERDVYDASKHPTLIKNLEKMPWNKVSNMLLMYLETTRILFARSDVLVNPERRVQGIKIDDKMIQKTAEKLQKEAGFA